MKAHKLRPCLFVHLSVQTDFFIYILLDLGCTRASGCVGSAGVSTYFCAPTLARLIQEEQQRMQQVPISPLGFFCISNLTYGVGLFNQRSLFEAFLGFKLFTTISF